VSRAIVARAPTRLDMGGGWTDVSPYADEHGGAVCNVAITRYATATVALRDEGASSPATRGDALVRAALQRAGMPNATAAVASDFPLGSGLGGSSAAGVALAGALAELRGNPLECSELAEQSRRTEVEELGIAGGFQDHYAAAFGGALLLTYEGCVGVERLALAEGTAAALTRRGVLVYTGQSRISAANISAVADACRIGDPRVCDALARMKALAREMAAALRSGDLDALGTLVGEHWTHQRALHPAITTQRIEEIARAAERAGALGMKALGASGGGCVLAIARDGREEELAHALAPLGERIDFAVDHRGFDVIAVLEGKHGGAERDRGTT
jgi:D-glycero-alpha-D-manno-heptose-7-phosphate kinase